MKSMYSLFPLNMVAFPGEKLNLHIFEPRYKQLITDALASDKLFGIPTFVKAHLDFGTLVKITEVSMIYEDGRMDIKTEGVQIFKIEEYENPWRDKLYAAGIISSVQNVDNGTVELQNEIRQLVGQFYNWMKMEQQSIFSTHFSSFDIAHKVGLTLEQEYEFIQLSEESHRQQFLISHLKKALSVLGGIHETQFRIQQNGHFKHFDPLSF